MQRRSSIELRSCLADNVRVGRKQLEYSQEQLADVCGLHRTYIGSVERCERNVTLSTLEALAEALNTTVPELLTHGGSSGRDTEL